MPQHLTHDFAHDHTSERRTVRTTRCEASCAGSAWWISTPPDRVSTTTGAAVGSDAARMHPHRAQLRVVRPIPLARSTRIGGNEASVLVPADALTGQYQPVFCEWFQALHGVP
ncbi:hypothetical protein GCM10009541_27790 [Micromonospora gifhornensis]|uniref:Uncharacterized protein n=1 Tax=Micromonospora gifhornensis TaxID=84594 RepID=A0ABQ4I812_9ACTN|nr:hypothetical protein Vgi01_06950 [Micromonospora gifhornensis]